MITAIEIACVTLGYSALGCLAWLTRGTQDYSTTKEEYDNA